MRPALRLFLASMLIALPLVHPPARADEIPAAKLRQLTDDLRDPGGAKREIPASRVTLELADVPIWEALAAIERQTGNKAIDRLRELDASQDAAVPPRVSCDFDNESYWSAIDELLDAAGLDVHVQSGSDALALVPRARGTVARVGRAAYDGAFRVEAVDVQAQRNLRRPSDASLLLQLQIAWEPRLRPIAIIQAAADLEATVDSIASLSPQHPDAVFNAEVPLHAQAVDLIVPFALPPRTAPDISSLRGKLRALVPARQAKFEFGQLDQAAGKSRRQDDVEIVIDRLEKNDEIWELHMRLQLDARNHALRSHRGWAFENRSYLVDARGEVIENIGLETVSESEQEVGVAYFFDLLDGLNGLTWVYETPVGMAETAIEYELRDVPLP